MPTSPIIGFIGRRGSGKTLLMTIFILKMTIANARAGITTTIYSTYDIKFPAKIKRYVVFNYLDHDNFEMLFKRGGCYRLKNVIFAIDEVSAYMGKYGWMKEEAKTFCLFAMQSRKRHVNIMYTGQTEDQAVRMLRINTELMIYPRYDCSRDSIKYDVGDWDGMSSLITSTRQVDGVSRYFGYYDTDQIVMPYDSVGMMSE